MAYQADQESCEVCKSQSTSTDQYSLYIVQLGGDCLKHWWKEVPLVGVKCPTQEHNTMTAER